MYHCLSSFISYHNMFILLLTIVGYIIWNVLSHTYYRLFCMEAMDGNTRGLTKIHYSPP